MSSLNLRTKRRFDMAIEDRNLSVGTKLWARYKGETYTAEVVKKEGETGNDAILYRLSDGREFKSPSAAGTAITQKACNGWAFWSTGDPSDQTGPTRTTRAPRSNVNAVPKPEPKARRGRKPKDAEGADGSSSEPPPSDETAGEAIECGQCGAILPNAEAAAA